MEAVQRRFLDLMQFHDIPIAGSYFCTHTPDDRCECRKPAPFLLERAAADHSIDLSASYMVGDREGDILSGRSAGCSTIWLRNEIFPVVEGLGTFVANDWNEIYRKLARNN
jgi:D-glycero-D-manno-heptose 1,7-bisphosphate phosphatase